MRFYVYIYRYENAPVYVGKGKGRRAWSHQAGKSHNLALRWLSQYCLERQILFEPEIVWRTNDELEALAYEEALIRAYGFLENGGTLVNKALRGYLSKSDIESKPIVKQHRLAVKAVRRSEAMAAVINTKAEEFLRSFTVKTEGIKYWERDLFIRAWRRQNRAMYTALGKACADGDRTDWKEIEVSRADRTSQLMDQQRKVRLSRVR